MLICSSNTARQMSKSIVRKTKIRSLRCSSASQKIVRHNVIRHNVVRVVQSVNVLTLRSVSCCKKMPMHAVSLDSIRLVMIEKCLKSRWSPSVN
ncbi:Uncharacterised protein [Vibrio cholerae]|nr:Uncharacterised protein [Vibrio cholerae]CSI62574.1 Uncharacterised protein [Vibrio cholerae]